MHCTDIENTVKNKIKKTETSHEPEITFVKSFVHILLGMFFTLYMYIVYNVVFLSKMRSFTFFLEPGFL